MEAKLDSSAEDYQLIRRYFDYDLNDQELTGVIDRMENDDLFLERMRIFQESDGEILSRVNVDNVVEREIKPKPIIKKNSLQINRIFAIAASIALILGILTTIWLVSNSTPNYSLLAQENWESSEKISFSSFRTVKSNENTNLRKTDTLLINASNFFQQKDFPEALNLLSSIEFSDELAHKAALLKGEIYLEQKQFQEAVEQFQIVIEHPNNEHNDYAYWYQTLAYLHLDQVEDAKKNVDFILEQRYTISNAEKLRAQLE